MHTIGLYRWPNMPVETKEGEKKKEKFESYGQVPLD
jgi:hypothetical protein